MMNIKNLLFLSFLAIAGLAFGMGKVPAPSAVSFDGLVLIQRIRGECGNSTFYGSYVFVNRTKRKVSFLGTKAGKYVELDLSGKGKLEVLKPERGWRPFVGPVAGNEDERVISLAPGESKEFLIIWPVDALVDFTADTQFRASVVDTNGQVYVSEPFKLHDGVKQLRVENLGYE